MKLKNIVILKSRLGVTDLANLCDVCDVISVFKKRLSGVKFDRFLTVTD